MEDRKTANAYFPMFVDISGMKIVVIGGGNIAARRIRTLLQFASDITVISPEAMEAVRQLEAQGRIRWIPRGYRTEDIQGADMVLAATNDKPLNEQIVRDCREAEQHRGRKILVNAASDKALCDFYFPSIIKQDDIVIGINSGGKDPGKVKAVRERLERS